MGDRPLARGLLAPSSGGVIPRVVPRLGGRRRLRRELVELVRVAAVALYHVHPSLGLPCGRWPSPTRARPGLRPQVELASARRALLFPFWHRRPLVLATVAREDRLSRARLRPSHERVQSLAGPRSSRLLFCGMPFPT